MKVPHEFILNLIKESQILSEIFIMLEIPEDKQNDSLVVMEIIRTLQTVYELHKRGYAEKEIRKIEDATLSSIHNDLSQTAEDPGT